MKNVTLLIVKKKKKCGTKLIVLSNQSTVAFARKNN